MQNNKQEISLEKKDWQLPISKEEFEDRARSLRTLSDATNFFKDMLEAEMDNHLGYPKNNIKGNLSGNNRNGHYNKNIKTDSGTLGIKIPRDRNSEFEPIVVRKYETVESNIEEKIISMYAKGMTTRDINEHMKSIYKVDVSAEMVSTITDKILPLVKEWQIKPLDKIYPIVYLDAVHFKVRESGKIISKAAYIILGINMDGKKK